MITHHEITAGLWLLVFASGGIVGRLTAWRYVERKLDSEYAAGKAEGRDEGWNAGYYDVPRPGDSGGRAAEVPSLATMDGPVAGPGRLLSAGELDPDAPWCPGCGFANYSSGPCDCGFDPDVVRPAGPSPAAGRTIYPELAELATRDAESDAQALAVPASVDPHWYANGLHWLADWQADWHEDAARFDAWLPGYLDWYRRSLEPKWALAGRMLEGL